VFLPRHSVAPAMLPLDLCLLGLFWACHLLFSYSIHIAQCFCWVNPYAILGFLGASHSFGHTWPIPFLHSHELLLRFLGFPGPIPMGFRGLLAFVPTSFANSFLLGSSGPFLLAFYFL